MAQDSETIVIRGFGNISYIQSLSSAAMARHSRLIVVLWPKPYEIDPMTYDPVPGSDNLGSLRMTGFRITFQHPGRRELERWRADQFPRYEVRRRRHQESPEVASWRAADFINVEGVEIIDDKTYKVVLNKPDCTVFRRIRRDALLCLRIVSQADFSDFREWRDQHQSDWRSAVVRTSWTLGRPKNFRASTPILIGGAARLGFRS